MSVKLESDQFISCNVWLMEELLRSIEWHVIGDNGLNLTESWLWKRQELSILLSWSDVKLELLASLFLISLKGIRVIEKGSLQKGMDNVVRYKI